MIKQTNHQQALKHMDILARLMDDQFRIPGTGIRFGLDAIIGLVPGIGDISTFLVSGYMLVVLNRNGASGFVMARMVLNIVVDTLIGMVPLMGDVFDVAFKANTRNMKLMREHYTEGRHRGGAWKVIVPLLLFLFLFIAAVVWATYKLLAWMF